MSEPSLIRNDSPHQVSLAEGTHLAVGKKVDVLAPLEQTVTLETDGPAMAHSLQDEFVAVPEVVLEKSAVEQPTFVRELIEERALAPVTVTPPESDAPMAVAPEPPAVVFVAEVPLAASPPREPVLGRFERPQFVPTPAIVAFKMLPMDFPARVINLKIESDKVRLKLEALQSSIRN